MDSVAGASIVGRTPACDKQAALGDALLRTAERHPSHGITYINEAAVWHFQTYPALIEEASCILSGLRESGLSPGDPVLFQFTDNRDFIGAFWACLLGGFVPVPLSPVRDGNDANAPARKFINAWRMLRPPVVLASPSIVDVVEGLLAAQAAPDSRVVSVADVRRNPATRAWHRPKPDDLALLLLTSGSTGKPKAVRQTHRTLLGWAESVGPACGFGPQDISLNWMPLDHVGGIVMFHLRDLVTGCRQVHGPTEAVLREPTLWLDWMEKARATITWAPNFAFALVNDQVQSMAGRTWDLSAMAFILNGGEAIVAKTARRFLELLAPHGLRPTAMRPAWGMSETCSGVTYASGFSLATSSDSDPFVCVGAAVPGIEIRIVDAAGQPVPDGTTGRLEVRGISITPGYHADPQADRASFTSDGWFITGDLAFVRNQQLTIAGREKDVIIVNGANYYCHELEAIAEEASGVEVSFTAACAVRESAQEAEKVALFFVAKPDAAANLEPLKRDIRRRVSLQAGVALDHVIALAADEVPKSAIGKIQRSELKRRFEDGLFAGRTERRAIAGEFLRLLWRPAANPVSSTLSVPSTVLILGQAEGIAGALSRALSAAGHRPVLVQAADRFIPVSADRFAIDPVKSDDYRHLFQALRQSDALPSHIVCCWAHGNGPECTGGNAERAISFGMALLHLLVAAQRNEIGGRVLLLSSGALATGQESGIDVGKLPLAGLVRTAAREFDTIALSHLDLPTGEGSVEMDVVIGEFGAEPGAVVALRDGKRLVLDFDGVQDAPAEQASAITRGGLYLVSGGSGGVGRAVARHLIERHAAKLVLLGRAEGAPRWVADELGDSALYAAGDIADAAFVRSALARGAERWGIGLSGVFHLAGTYHEAPIEAETAVGLRAVLAPKLAGAWSLHQVAHEAGDCLFVSFSSVLGQFGTYGMAAYASANAALDLFSVAQRQEGVRAYSLAWSIWRGLGMAQPIDVEVPKRRGFAVLEPDHALTILDGALRQPPGCYVIGANAAWSVSPQSAPRVAIGDPRVAPATDLEIRIARMWQDLLNLPNVDANESFFDLGGSSLIAARLFNRIEKELGARLPIATLYGSPTVAGLARAVGKSEAPAADIAFMATLRNGGESPPLFVIPGVGGDAISFHAVAAWLGEGRAVYGLQVPGLDAAHPSGSASSIEQVAAEFVRLMRSVRPAGPYHIAGYCFGALLAWEVARQMRAEGAPVGVVALLDPIAGDEFPGEMTPCERARHALYGLGYSVARLAKRPLAQTLRSFRDKPAARPRDAVAQERMARAYDMARRLFVAYELRPFDGRVTVFLAADSYLNAMRSRDPRRFFGRIARGGVTYVTVAGDHDSMLFGPGTADLVKALSARLEAEERGCRAPTPEKRRTASA